MKRCVPPERQYSSARRHARRRVAVPVRRTSSYSTHTRAHMARGPAGSFHFAFYPTLDVKTKTCGRSTGFGICSAFYVPVCKRLKTIPQQVHIIRLKTCRLDCPECWHTPYYRGEKSLKGKKMLICNSKKMKYGKMSKWSTSIPMKQKKGILCSSWSVGHTADIHKTLNFISSNAYVRRLMRNCFWIILFTLYWIRTN
jgi:hypothetical protein